MAELWGGQGGCLVTMLSRSKLSRLKSAPKTTKTTSFSRQEDAGYKHRAVQKSSVALTKLQGSKRSPQRLNKALKVEWIAFTQTAKGVVGCAHALHASSAIHTTQKGFQALCGDPTVVT